MNPVTKEFRRTGARASLGGLLDASGALQASAIAPGSREMRNRTNRAMNKISAAE
jgi:hypothetical protein